MRHRAPRPLLDLWHRIPRGSARPLAALARIGPVRAVGALVLVLGLGGGAVATVAWVGDGPARRPDASGAPSEWQSAPASRSGERAASPASTPAGRPTTDGAGSVPSPDGPEPPASSTPTPLPSTPTLRQVPTPRAPSTPAAPTPSVPSPSATSSSPRDVEPPSTTAAGQQLGNTAVVSLGASEPASFTCSLDGTAYTSCSSPARYSGLESGWHDVRVRARDLAGNVDPTPAEYRWHVNGGPSGQQ